MSNPMEGKYVYATTDKAVHNAIVEMFARKSGASCGDDDVSGTDLDYNYLEVNSHNEVVSSYRKSNLYKGAKEITLAELEAMPDYVEPPKAKEMTVAAISAELGYEVKIVK